MPTLNTGDLGNESGLATIRTMMIPLSRCATVHEDETIHDAITAQVKASGILGDPTPLLVRNREERIVGKVDYLDLVIGVEDGYRKIGDLKGVSHLGFTREFIMMMIESNKLWQDPLKDICRRAAGRRIGEIMSRPGPDEFVDEDSPLAEAIHRLALGHFQCLLVKKAEKVTGMLRMQDLFVEICDEIRRCDS